MFDMTDSIVSSGDRAIQTQELYGRAMILDQHDRPAEENQALSGILKDELDPLVASNESLIGFLSDKLASLFGSYTNHTPPDPLLLQTETKKFLREVEQTFCNEQWVKTRQYFSNPIDIGVQSREWMIGHEVLNDVDAPLRVIMASIDRELSTHGPAADNYFKSLRTLSEAMYKVDPVTALDMALDHQKKRPMPVPPEPLRTWLGNYKVSKSVGWWTIEVRPSIPAAPKLISPLNWGEVKLAGNTLAMLLGWLLTHEEKLGKFNFVLDDKEAIASDPAKRAWWERAEKELGQDRLKKLWAVVDPYQVCQKVTGLLPIYRSIMYRYAKSFHARMRASFE